jgi:hypothetical protein
LIRHPTSLVTPEANVRRRAATTEAVGAGLDPFESESADVARVPTFDSEVVSGSMGSPSLMVLARRPLRCHSIGHASGYRAANISQD